MNKVLVDYKYTNEDVVNTLKLLSPRTTNMNPVRIGNAIDGGYVLLEELIKQNGIIFRRSSTTYKINFTPSCAQRN